jgi:hypothetical protein
LSIKNICAIITLFGEVVWFMPRIKRHRGGQPGNQNAHKHGFFSSAMTPQEISEFWQNIKSGGGDRQLAVFRIKLVSALRASPGNPRIVKEASRLLTKLVCSQHAGASREDMAYARKVIRFVCNQIGEYYSKTNEAKMPETAEIITKRIESKS